jgi:hypothetical protein
MKITFTLFLVITYNLFYAQTSVNATGTTVSSSSGSNSYSVGQVVYSINSTIPYSITQGVQQPYTILDASNVEELNSNLVINVFPNPTTQDIIITLVEPSDDILEYHLINELGKVIESGVMNEHMTQISITHLAVSNLRLQIVNKQYGNILKSFNLIKF